MNSWSLLSEELKLYLPLVLLVLAILFFKLIKKYFHNLRKNKRKKLKYEGGGVMKKSVISAVKQRYVGGNDDSSGYYLYRLEAKDEMGNVYCSEEFKNLKHGGRTLEEMKKKYDGVVYDLGDKDNAIRQINDNMHRLETELQNDPGFFKKIGLKREIKIMKKYLDMAEEGPITPYLIINGHKISVGDTVDVFVDLNNPKSYYFDLEFTEEMKGEF